MRVSTIVLIVAFIALCLSQLRAPAGVHRSADDGGCPARFVPDPNYTWVPRTNVRKPEEPVTTTTTTPTTTSPTETTTTSPGETTSPTSPTESTPTTTVGPGPLGPQTITGTPTLTPTTPTTPTAPGRDRR